MIWLELTTTGESGTFHSSWKLLGNGRKEIPSRPSRPRSRQTERRIISHPFREIISHLFRETKHFKLSKRMNDLECVFILRNLSTNQLIAKQSHQWMNASECYATNTFASIALVPDIKLQIANVVYCVKFVRRSITPPSVIGLVSN